VHDVDRAIRNTQLPVNDEYISIIRRTQNVLEPEATVNAQFGGASVNLLRPGQQAEYVR
jgi:hypothetical protein